MMERRIKERLIGATLLVVLVVLIVPEMLSGPTQRSAPPLTAGLPAPTRSVSVDLATSKATAEPDLADSAPASASPASASPAPSPSANPLSAGLPPDAPAPGSEGRDNDDAADGSQSAQTLRQSAPTVTTLGAQKPADAALETPPSPPISGSRTGARPSLPGSSASQGHRGWSVQLGSFASKANAEKLLRQLEARGGSLLYVSASGAGPKLRYRVRMGPLADRGAAEHAAGKLRAAGHAATIVAPAS
jgi:DedD protein